MNLKKERLAQSGPKTTATLPRRNFSDCVRITAKRIASTLTRQRTCESILCPQEEGPVFGPPMLASNSQLSPKISHLSQSSTSTRLSSTNSTLAKYRKDLILHHLNLVDKAGLGHDTSVVPHSH